jgi:hypothetical protein
MWLLLLLLLLLWIMLLVVQMRVRGVEERDCCSCVKTEGTMRGGRIRDEGTK